MITQGDLKLNQKSELPSREWIVDLRKEAGGPAADDAVDAGAGVAGGAAGPAGGLGAVPAMASPQPSAGTSELDFRTFYLTSCCFCLMERCFY